MKNYNLHLDPFLLDHTHIKKSNNCIYLIKKCYSSERALHFYKVDKFVSDELEKSMQQAKSSLKKSCGSLTGFLSELCY